MPVSASEILHDFLYGRPEHPVPHAGEVTTLVYPAREDDVEVTLVTDERCLANLSVAAPASVVDAALAAAHKHAVPGSSEEAIASGALSWIMSMAILRTHVMPLLPAQPLSTDKVTAGQELRFSMRYPLFPAARVSSFEPLEIDPPELPVARDEMIVQRMLRLAKTGDSAGDASLPEEGTNEYKNLHARAKYELEQELNRSWAAQLTDMCQWAFSQRLVGEIPAPTAAYVAEDLFRSFARQIDTQGIGWQKFISMPGVDLEQIRQNYATQALAGLRQQLAARAMAQHVGVVLKQKDVLAAAGMSNVTDPEAALEQLLLTNRLVDICNRLVHSRGANIITKQAAAAAEAKTNPEAALVEELKAKAEHAGEDQQHANAEGTPNASAAPSTPGAAETPASEGDGASGQAAEAELSPMAAALLAMVDRKLAQQQ